MGFLPITIFLLLILITKPSSAQNSSYYDDYYPLLGYPVAMEGCESLCGDVSIPYPFGMEVGCYFNEQFAIECRSSNSINDAGSTLKPLLRINNLEVLEISVRDNLLRVNIHEITRNCPTSGGGWNSSTSIDLRGSPFFFSNYSNIFISVGCNNHAWMMYVNGQTNKNSSSSSTNIIAQCGSICDKSEGENKCFGINCCQTTIGQDDSLQVFTASLSSTDQNINNITGSCSYAFLVDKAWFMSNVTDPFAVQKMTRVPAVLDWRLLNVTTDQLGIDNRIALSGQYCTTSDANLPDGCIVAKEGCEPRCGNVSIPYPFGIGPARCYFDEQFAIECRSSNTSGGGSKDASSTPKPFLKRHNLEVLGITLGDGNNLLRVNNPEITRNCPTSGGGWNSSTSIDLRGSPFFFSNESNIFISVGCNNHTRMTYGKTNKDSSSSSTNIIAQCGSICDKLVGDNKCFGINCCQTTIGDGRLQVFTANLSSTDQNINNINGSCSYGFLVDREWFMSTVTDPFAVENMARVPAVLDWRLFTGTADQLSCESTSAAYLSCICINGNEGNPYLPNGCLDVCWTDPNKPWCRKNNKMTIVGACVGSIVGALLLLTAAWWLYKAIKKRNDVKRKKKFFQRNGGFLLQQQVSSSNGSIEKTKLFDSNVLEKATDHYNENRVLGKGGQGTVYKGMLSDGRIVAVKKSKIVEDGKIAVAVEEGDIEQFINEVVILSQINHRNVVKLLGCCLETEVPLLVYEFISNGTLFQLIHDSNEEFPFSWEARLQIAIEVAGALFYLHCAASIPIYHRDIKSTNILLDDKYKAKVADFGTSRTVAIDQTHLTTFNVHGTFGYLDPEYFQSSQFTEKSDVYSFGVVIVELLTKEKPISTTRSKESRSLATYFIQAMNENRLLEILDPQILKEDGRRDEMIAVAHLARRCLSLNGRKRPTMKEVATELEGIKISSRGGSMTQPNFEEVGYDTNDRFGEWDASNTSTSTFYVSCKATSFDVQPLLLNNS